MADAKLDNWGDWTSNFIKAKDVTSEQDAWVVTGVVETDRDPKGLRASLERMGVEYGFDLNKTNSTFLKNMGVVSPIKLVGKKIYFKKALVRNPKTNMEVEGLRIWKVE